MKTTTTTGHVDLLELAILQALSGFEAISTMVTMLKDEGRAEEDDQKLGGTYASRLVLLRALALMRGNPSPRRR